MNNGYMEASQIHGLTCLTIRQEFAARVLAGLASIPYEGGQMGYPEELLRQDAELAVRYADALIAALEDSK